MINCEAIDNTKESKFVVKLLIGQKLEVHSVTPTDILYKTVWMVSLYDKHFGLKDHSNLEGT